MHAVPRTTLALKTFFLAASLTGSLLAQTAAPSQAMPPAGSSAASTRAYADYLKAFEIAETGSRPAALRLLGESLRLDPHNNPAAQLAFNLLVEQRANTPVKLLGETAIFSSVTYSPDGARILTTATDKTARLWDAATGAPLLPPIVHDEEIAAAAFSPDGHFFATGTDEGEVTVWDASSGKPRFGSMKLSSGAVWSISFSPDGTILAAASDGGRARTWDAASGKPLAPEMEYHEAAYRISFSKDSRYVLIPTGDNYADVRDARTGARRFKLVSANTLVYAQYDPGGNSIIAAGSDSRVRLWNAATGQPTPVQLQHGYAVEYAGFNADGHRILTASRDHTARVWDAQSGNALTPPLQHPAPVFRGDFSPDNQWAFTLAGDKAVRLWSVTSGDPVMMPVFFPNGSLAAFNPTSPTLLMAGGSLASIVALAPGENAPAWLAELAEFASTLNNFDHSVAPDLNRVETIKRELQSSSAKDPWTVFGQWYFTDIVKRPVFPGSSLTLEHYVDLLIARGDRPSLVYAQLLSRPFPSWLAKVDAALAKLPPQSP